jgi:hypothetical protein
MYVPGIITRFGIKAIPFEIFHAYDLNRKKYCYIHTYPIYPVGTVVLRKPSRMGKYVPIGVFDFDPEPFIVNRVEGKLQGKYELRSLVIVEFETRGYKLYEIRTIPKSMLESLFYFPILLTYLRKNILKMLWNTF